MLKNILDKNARISLFALLFIFVISLIIVTAENTTENSSEETIQPSENLTEVVEDDSNDTISISENTSLNNETLIENISDETSEENNSELTVNETPETPNLEIEISHSNKITRGDELEINAVVSNSGDLAEDVTINWIVPEEFEVISNNQRENCGNVGNNEQCISTIQVQPSLSAPLGINEIKVEVGYR